MYNVTLVVSSCYGPGLWFSTRTPFSNANGAQRARRCQWSSDPGYKGKSQISGVGAAGEVVVWSRAGLIEASIAGSAPQ